MIAYRDYRDTLDTDLCISRIETLLQKIPSSPDMYTDAIDLLIETAEFETAYTDFLCSEYDHVVSDISMCRNISMCAGNVVCNLWNKNELSMEKIFRIHTFISALKARAIPKKLPLSLPEGFAYYGLYPEAYIDAAHKFFEEMMPESAVVIGLRSIGTPLSAVVAAELDLCGCNVISCTVRPRGEPFDRKLILDEMFSKNLQQSTGSFFLVVDEGPGLSGSSIGGTLEKLNDLGIKTSNTIIFPSWLPDPSSFISETARNIWCKYKKYTGDFEQLWVRSGRLEESFEKKIVRNISAGMWRELCYKREAEFPCSHPHHERRKFLLESVQHKKSLAKFTGLGKYSERLIHRATLLAHGGFSPKIEKIKNGFSIMNYFDGKPLRQTDVSIELLKFVSDYLVFIKNNCQSPSTVSFDKMIEMIYQNVKSSMGDRYCSFVDKIQKECRSFYDVETVAVD